MMNRSLFQKFPPVPGDQMSQDGKDIAPGTGEGLINGVLKLIKIITNGRSSRLPEADSPDVAQDTALRLWKWHQKFPERSNGMSPEEWHSFAATSAYNEVNRYKTKLSKNNEVPLVFIPELEDLTQDVEAELEMKILVRAFWQGICKLSLYQRRALLLHSAEIGLYLMQFGISEEDIADKLSFDEEEWRYLSLQMPLTDIEIAKLMKGNGNGVFNAQVSVRNIKKARYDARKNLGKLIR